MKDKRAFVIYILLTVILWQLCDSLSVIFSKSNIDNPIFSISTTNNTGAAFGILNNSSLFLGFLGIIAIFCIGFYVFKKVSFENRGNLFFTSFFSAGILGNTVQRMTDGVVFDFIKLNFIEFPIFNLFDILICTSVIIYILCCFKGDTAH